jgi:fatty acid desaturase
VRRKSANVGDAKASTCEPHRMANKQQILRYLRVFVPKGSLQWLFAALYGLLFAVYILPSLKTTAGAILALAVLALFVAGAVFLPSGAIATWERLPPNFRGLCFAVLIYVLTVTLGWMPEIQSPHDWTQLLALAGPAPYSGAHTTALVGVVPAWLSQLYRARGVAPSPPGEQFLRGAPQVLTWEEAMAKLMQIIKKTGWE